MKYILWYNQINNKDVPIVGGKNASLGEMYTKLIKKGVNIPNGFCITSEGYKHFIKSAKIDNKIKQTLKGLNTKNTRNLAKKGKAIRQLILNAELPEDLKEEIKLSYKKLNKIYGTNTDVAVRSSATAEDLPTASFAGQQETYLNISGEKQLIESCKRCFASLFTNRSISYRVDKGFDHLKVYLSIGIQKMIRSDLATSGVMFSIDTESGFKNAVYITASYGLGENIVQGAVNPDEYYVFKPTLNNYKPIISKKVGDKKIKMIYNMGGVKPVKNVSVPLEDQRKFAITDKEILQLAKWAVKIEQHYQKPMDIEWAKDGKTNKLFIVQARPETVNSQKQSHILKTYKLQQKSKILIEGKAVGEKIGQGPVNIIKSAEGINNFKKGQVLVTEMTDPDWEPIMKIASAIVTNKGGRTCHAAIVSRELGIPCIVGTNNATEKLKQKQKVTVSCSEGEIGFVYDKLLKFKVHKINITNIKKSKTKIMMNLGNPEQAFSLASLPIDGIGLAREEFIINSYIKIHPNALINYKKLDKKTKAQIDELTFNYKDKTKFYIDKLAEGVATLAASVYPKPIIVRFSDFKSNEYANLIGGQNYEPQEDNPMIGFRGASRYYSKNFKQAFILECKAIKKARDEFGLKNIKVMIPFCRTIEEGKKVLEIMKKQGLKQSKTFKVYVMCEIPANVILGDQFAKLFDGFSIGSNDLTQLTLGVDRDSEIVSHIFDERNQAVKDMVKQIIKTAKKNKVKIGICGDAPSTYPEFAKFLIKNKIDSISLSPDAVLKTLLKIK